MTSKQKLWSMPWETHRSTERRLWGGLGRSLLGMKQLLLTGWATREWVGCHCLQGPSWRWSEHEKGRRLSVATEAQTPSAYSM